MSNCTFLNNFAEYGGSIATTYSHISFTNNTHNDNFAANLGGAIYAQGYTVTVFKDDYHGNTAGFEGGAIFVHVDSFTSINSHFTKNVVGLAGDGGTITVVLPNNGSCIFSGNTFILNRGCNGGALTVVLSNNCSCHSSANQFINNTALSNGGAIYVQMNGSSTSYSSSYNQFIGNVASTRGGGAIAYNFFFDSGHFNSSYNLFQNNEANKDGGAIERFYDSHSNGGGVFYSSHNTFVGNKVRILRGGAIYIKNLDTGDDIRDYILNNLYINNTAMAGGAVYEGVVARNLHIENAEFVDNVAEKLYGGAFAFLDGVIEIYDSAMKGNQGSNAIKLYRAHFFGRGCRLHNNIGSLLASNSVLEIDGTFSFIENHSQFGGALMMIQSTIHFKSTATVEISRNSAYRAGGILLSESRLNISCSVNITSNTAMKVAGGIYAYRSEITFHGSRKTVFISNNKALKYGGDALLISSILSIFQGTVIFHKNSANEVGGAMYLELRSSIYLYYLRPTKVL